MASDRYQVRLTRPAEKDLDDLGPLRDQAVGELLSLEEEPYRGHTLKGSLLGARSLEFSMPGGAYRALYVVREEMARCIVWQVGPHEGLYSKRTVRRYRAFRKSE